MQTHFRPRADPLPASTSPVRPSTAHSTIRAITPSPPNSSDGVFVKPRPKSEHVFGSPELSTYREYVFQAEAGGFSNTPDATGGKLQRGGIASGRSSPIKPGRSSPVKPDRSSPTKSGRFSPIKPGRFSPIKSGQSSPAKSPREEALSILEGGNLSPSPASHDSPILSPTKHMYFDPNQSPPDTPTPMTRKQKRQAYAPQGSSTVFATAPQPFNLTKPVAGNRVSAALSTASKHSIFSTPGRDELERKKALVESDEGPFAKAKSMGDLRVERARVGTPMEEGESEEVKAKKEKKKWGCGLSCMVM